MNAGYWEVDLTGDEMKVYVEIDIAKDKFDYCALDRDNKIICKGSNRKNSTDEFKKFSETINALKNMGTVLNIGMESTGIYRVLLHQHFNDGGFHVRILNGLKVKRNEEFKVRKTSTNTIDAESIVRYLMVTDTKDSYEFP